MSAVEEFADSTTVLDEWTDEARRDTITIYALRADLQRTGFCAIARSPSGTVVGGRVFIITDEGLRALTPPEVRALGWRIRGWRRRFEAVAWRLVSGALLALLMLGCGPSTSPPASETGAPAINGCQIVVPRQLPSGAPTGEFRVTNDGRLAWGNGADLVVEAVGELAIGHPGELAVPQEGKQRVLVRGWPAVVMPLGDVGVSEVVITWQANECGYTVWLSRGSTLEKGIAYAGDF